MTDAIMALKTLTLVLPVSMAPRGAHSVEVMSKGKPIFTSTIFFRKYVMAADAAAMPLRKREAETAVESGNLSSTKRGEKMSPPPSPTMVKTKEIKKITIRRRNKGMVTVPGNNRLF